MSAGLPPLVIRADANRSIGAGHIMRCLALAQGWLAANGKVIAVTACDSEALRSRLVEDGLDVTPLRDPNGWDVLAATLDDYPNAWVVLDGYHFTSTDQLRLKRIGHRVLVVDDLAPLDHYAADLIVNQNLGAQDLVYACDPPTRLLRGTDYVLLRKEFLSTQLRCRDTRGVASRILVTLGGADPDNATLKIVRALQRLESDNLEVVVAIGPSYPHGDALQQAVKSASDTSMARKGRSPAITVVRNTAAMPDLMAWADLAVSAGGTTVWELAYMGVPSLLVILASNQQRSVDGLSALGVAENLGWHRDLTEHDAAEAIHRLRTDRSRRASMSAAGQALVDGQGVKRVIAAMQWPSTSQWDASALRLRPASFADAAFLWRLTNDPTVRSTSFNHDPVPYTRHLEWLTVKLASPDTCQWILEIDGEPVAQIRYDRKTAELAEVGFSVVASLRGRGLGARLLELTADLAGQALHVKRLHGRLFAHNVASQRAFVKTGYHLAETFEVDQTLCYTYERTVTPDA